jgi:hypothetical protein
VNLVLADVKVSKANVETLVDQELKGLLDFLVPLVTKDLVVQLVPKVLVECVVFPDNLV